VHGKSRSRTQVPQRVLQLPTEIPTVGSIGQRIVVGQPGDLLFRLAPLRNVLLNVHPAAATQRLIGNLNDPS
jgi:hypothetical protein